jgi:hypothetical protein
LLLLGKVGGSLPPGLRPVIYAARFSCFIFSA